MFIARHHIFDRGATFSFPARVASVNPLPLPKPQCTTKKGCARICLLQITGCAVDIEDPGCLGEAKQEWRAEDVAQGGENKIELQGLVEIGKRAQYQHEYN